MLDQLLKGEGDHHLPLDALLTAGQQAIQKIESGSGDPMALLDDLRDLCPTTIEGDLIVIPGEVFDINATFLSPRATIL